MKTEQQYLTANGIQICYQEFGNKENPTVLLIQGLGMQLLGWPDLFCTSLAESGYRVIRYDNRDIGLSEKITHSKSPSIAWMSIKKRFGFSSKIPYELEDMANDAVGILDALGIKQAHFIGFSMGGMIAQLVAINHLSRIKSLTSMMSSTGNPSLPPSEKQVINHLLSKPKTDDQHQLIEHGIKTWQLIGSPKHPASEQTLRNFVTSLVERSMYPKGFNNHLAAIINNGSRCSKLRNLDLPSLVIHGDSDPLIPCEAGIDTANCIPNAQLEIIEGMGHDFPPEFNDTLIFLITQHLSKAT